MLNIFEITAILLEKLEKSESSLQGPNSRPTGYWYSALANWAMRSSFQGEAKLDDVNSKTCFMAGISNMLNIMKRQAYKKTSKIKLVLEALEKSSENTTPV